MAEDWEPVLLQPAKAATAAVALKVIFEAIPGSTAVLCCNKPSA